MSQRSSGQTCDQTRALKVVLRTALREAVRKADDFGVTRGEIASSLKIAAVTLDSWKNETTEGDIPPVQLVALLRREILPQDAKLALLNTLMRDTGVLAVIDDADSEDTGTPLKQLADVTIALGSLAASINKAASRDSDGGERMTSEEAKRSHDAVEELISQARELQRLFASMI
jgi:hypothetical protein